MNKSNDEEYKSLIAHYINAKDNNKSHLMEKAFVNSATLEMVVKTEAITFPSNSEGLTDITNVLVKNFNQTYENIYTLCLSDTLTISGNKLSCNWLVGMNDRESGNVRVGAGIYNWQFNNEPNTLATQLSIIIDQMITLAPDFSGQIMHWLSNLVYPWCGSSEVLQSIPNLDELHSIRAYIN